MENRQEYAFLAREYARLWKDYGLDVPRLEAAIMNRLDKVTKKTTRPMGQSGPSVFSKPTTFSSLADIQAHIGACTRCGLCEGRNKLVFGTGNPHASLMFVGEGPGADEDASGLPFVGRAGQLLTKIIEAMGMRRDDVYIANVVKCRPPQNRVPHPDEIARCSPFLRAQIEVVGPKLLVALGGTAAIALTGNGSSMATLRGKFHWLPWHPKIPILATYHPAYLLRNPSAKRIVWEDMKLAMKKLEATV